MKIIITIAIILNIYGVLSFTHQSNEYHHYRHRHSNDVNRITADELADVLLSLPGSKGRQAYRSFLSLGEFLPVETKAHKFFNSIAEAIRRKSAEEISELRRIQSPQPSAFSSNPIFMMQPAGYHMAPLPLHPMFSSSPLDLITRVPCTHTKMIAVPMHTFDVSISSITRQFGPAQNPFDGLQGSDDDDEDDKSYFNEEEEDEEDELNKLLDLIGFPNSKGEDKKVAQSPKPEENEAEQSPKEGDEKTESPKLEGDEITESPKPEDGEIIESPKSEGDEITESPKAEEVIESPKQGDDKAVQLPKQEEGEVTEPPNQDGVTESSTPEDEIRKQSPKPEDEVIESSKPEGNEAVQSPKQEDEVNQLVEVEQPSTPPDNGVTESLKPEEGEEEQLPKQVEDEVKESSKQEDETAQLPKQDGVEAAQSPIEKAAMQSPEQEETTEPKKESVEEQEIQEPQLAEVPSAKTSQVRKRRGPPKVRKAPGLDSTTEDEIKPVPGRKPRRKKIETQPQQQ